MKLLTKIFEKLRVIPPILKGNQPCYDKYGRFIGWFSRSMATALFVYAKNKNGEWCILASERGEEAADFRGYWNCCCGYLDYNETTKQCAIRELNEEVGVKLTTDDIQFVGYEDNPVSANHQNVTFRFCVFIEDKTTEDFTFSKALNEGKEVGDIKWIKLSDIDNHQWAFNHNGRIVEIFNNYKPNVE